MLSLRHVSFAMAFTVAAASITGAVAIAARVWRAQSRRSSLDAAYSLSTKYSAMIRQEDVSTTEGPRVMVFYGSATGNAEQYAKSLVSELCARQVDAALIDPSHWAHLDRRDMRRALFPLGSGGAAPIAIFIVATTGEGEVPANFDRLHAEMQSLVHGPQTETRHRVGIGPEGLVPFAGLSYAVFALGDKSYKYFCRAGFEVDRLLRRGGATAILPVATADARDALQEDAFEQWMERLLDALRLHCGVALTDASDAPMEPRFVFRFTPDLPAALLPFPPPPSLLEPSALYPAQLRLHAKAPLTQPREADGSFVLRLVVSTGGAMVSYQAGDHLGVYPVNPPDVVEAYRTALSITRKDWETPVELCSFVNARARASLRNVFPARVSLQAVFEHYLDLCGKPRKSMLRSLAKYCTDLQERTAMAESLRRTEVLTKTNGNINTDAKMSMPAAMEFRTVLDCLRQFPSCCVVPIGHFVEMMPRLQPRFFSIASDVQSHKTTIETFIRIIPDGLNSRYLQRVQIGDPLTAFVRKSTFHLPIKSGNAPVVMIGPGTGVASMIGFCHRRAALRQRYPNTSTGPMVLFFGAQHRESEYFVRDELQKWCPQGEGRLPPETDGAPAPIITLLDVAFSRDQAERYYVTHLIEKHRDYLLRLLNHAGCLLYLSGDASRMAKSVDEALLKLLQHGGMTRSAASEFLKKMEREKRYLKDVY